MDPTLLLLALCERFSSAKLLVNKFDSYLVIVCSVTALSATDERFVHALFIMLISVICNNGAG